MTDSPPASRLATPSWLDTRLVLGVLLVLVCVVVGARVLATADDSQRVWATTKPLAPGSTLSRGDLQRVQVRLFDSRQHYLTAGSGDGPVGYVVTRGLGDGELLPLAALRSPGELAELRDVSVPVQGGHLPGDLDEGQLVDVFVTRADSRTSASSAPTAAPGPTTLVLHDVPVKRRERSDRGNADEAVVLTVGVKDTATLVTALRGGTVDLVRVPHP